MAFIEGTDRFQSQLLDFFAFDNLIADDNYVRVINAFVDTLNLDKLGFITYSGDNRGQKPYHTDILLKIHIYCFFNGIQSSRKQERECSRNIELIWLTGNLKPDHSTISNFCKNNSDALKNVFKQFSNLCKKLDLYDFKVFAIDGTKVKAHCSKKRAYTLNGLEDALKHNEGITEYCATDPDAKIMKNHSNIEPCYNVQSVVDSKNKLFLDYDVTNQANDVGLLKPMVDKVFEDYELDNFLEDNPHHTIINLADTGYYKTDDLLALNSNNVKALVPKPKTTSGSGDSDFSKSAFSFDSKNDCYICPNNKLLTFSRKSKETRNGVTNYYKIYSCKECKNCPYYDKCTKSSNGRSIKRNINEDKILEIDNEYKKDSKFYKLRKELVEHPFGTIKRSLGLSFVNINGLERVSSWTSSVFLAYNLKRVINIMGIPKLMEVISTN